MTSQQHKAIKEREKVVNKRVTEINQRLKHVSRDYTVTYFSRESESWCILPRNKVFQEDGFPILGNKFRLLIIENLGTRADELIFTYFRYRLKKITDVSTEKIATDKLPIGWEFRYEFNPRGQEHAMPQACEPSTLQAKPGDRLPDYHMHVCERGTIGDDLHYPLGNPKNPFDLLFEIIRLISDEFIG